MARPNDWLTLVIVASAGVALGFGLFLPSIAFEQFFVFGQTHALTGAIIGLWRDGEYWLAIVLGLFSVVFPVLKLLLMLADGVARVSGSHGAGGRLTRLALRLGRWSMLDVFVVALVVFAIKGSGIADAATLPGIWVFCLAVLLSMWAADRLSRAHDRDLALSHRKEAVGTAQHSAVDDIQRPDTIMAHSGTDTQSPDNRPAPMSDYPADGSVRDRLRHLLYSAIQAPSSHNSQPWRFRLTDSCVEVHADATRRLPVVDPDDRELTMSCGAAIETLVAAMRRHGFLGDVDVAPEAGAPSLVARVALGGSYEPSAFDRAMFDAIPRRATYRLPFEDREIPKFVIDDIAEAAEQLGTDIRFLSSDRERRLIGDLVAEGDRHQFADSAFRAELAAWIHPKRNRDGDGLAPDVFGMPDIFAGVGAFAIRTFDMGDQQAARDREIAAHSPLIAILATPADQVRDWVACGRALAAMMLTLTAHGLAASYLNQPVEVPEVRRKLADTFTIDGMPQLVVRIGYPITPVIARSARRPFAAVVEET